MNKTIKLILIISILSVLLFTHLMSNCWLLLTDSHNTIPKQSNIFTFQPIQIDEGSGGYWRYAEDHHHYYYFSPDESAYYYISKQNQCAEFSSVHFATWCHPKKGHQ